MGGVLKWVLIGGHRGHRPSTALEFPLWKFHIENDEVSVAEALADGDEALDSDRQESAATTQSADKDASSEPSAVSSEGRRLLIQSSTEQRDSHDDYVCHLPHFIDRLLLEQYLEREFLLRLPFMFWLPILLILVTMEFPTGIMFEIHSNLRNHLGLDDVAEATTTDAIYDFLAATFLPGVGEMNPTDSQFVESSVRDGFIQLSQKKRYRQATALVTYPVLYIVRGPDSTGKCDDIGDFGRAYQSFFWEFYYCHLLPASPVEESASASMSNTTGNTTATGFRCGEDPTDLPDLLQCFDKSSDADTLPTYQSSWPVQNYIAEVMVKSGATRLAAVDVAPTTDRIEFYRANGWIDGSASAVGTITTFYTPVADIYTFVSVYYKIGAVGHIQGSVYLNSFKDVAPQSMWLVGMLLAIGLTLLQTGIDMFRAFHPGYLARGVGMKEYLLGMHAVHLGGPPPQSSPSTDKNGTVVAPEGHTTSASDEYYEAVRKRKRNLRRSAVFESLSDLLVLSTLVLKLAAYLPSVGLTVPSFLGTLEFSKVALSLLSWDPHNETGQYLTELLRASQIETLADSLRTLTMVILCLCCSRFVFFLATHPRVAILAETVRIGSDDMFHFFILFATLYSLLAFLARWVFGDSLAQFKSFNDALYTQAGPFR
ncbi:hypothetical protein FOZ60_007742 [Perkinsus olseni]|uniref:Uncharacterized protein n=2 Tax=Perkinsus olseni TaxID=32597 RepID=A0A7J6NKQ9_PEROL|nr:hypothetical protein FOZ60_007742 [Perkinsus olseni]